MIDWTVLTYAGCIDLGLVAGYALRYGEEWVRIGRMSVLALLGALR